MVRFSSAAVVAGSRASAAARSSVDLVEDKDYADICRDVGEVSVRERYRTGLSHTHTHRTQTHTRARTRRAHAPTWVRTIDFLWTACIRSTAGMRQVWCGRPRRHPPPAKERIFPAARPHQIAPFVSLALPPLPPLQGLHRVVRSDSTALRMDGTGPPKLGVGTADSRLPLSDAHGCSVMRAPSARLRASVCTGMLLGPYGCVTSESAYSNSNQDCDVVRESVRPVLVGGGRQQGAARHPWAAFRKQRESTPPNRYRCVRICEQRRNQTQFGLSPDPPSCGFPSTFLGSL